MISKKDLLKELDISYGQLYRWKREGLIPDDWFIKQSVSTGQETYFNENEIIPRIKKILELKDLYQLDEIKKFLNPDVKNKKFTIKEAICIEEIDPYILKKHAKGRQDLTIYDLIIVYIFSIKKHLLDYDDYRHDDFTSVNRIDAYFYILKSKNYYLIIANNDTYIDKQFKILEKISFEEVSTKLAKKLF